MLFTNDFTNKSFLHKSVATSGYIIFFGGLIVMLGWIFDIDILKSIVPGLVTMKFTTALSFVLSGIIIIYSNRQWGDDSRDTNDIVIATVALVLFLLMTSLIMSVIFGVKSGVEDIFIQEKQLDSFTTVPGRPSVGTMMAFVIIGTSGVLTLFRFPFRGKVILGLGLMLLSISIIAIFGYILNMPGLYYSLEGVSTAMAVHTAILFILSGLSLTLIGAKVRTG